MRENQQYELIDWDGFYHLCLELVDRILASGRKFDKIIGISRGGLVPARVISDELDNPDMVIVKVEFYTDIYKVKPEPKVVHFPDTNLEGLDVLVVDDVADSGRSLECVSRLLREKGVKSVSIATVFYKPWSLVVPDFYVRTTEKWIVFPHEQREAMLAIAKRLGESSQDAVRQRLIDIGFEPSLVDRTLRRKA
jgi:hypothetical protein